MGFRFPLITVLRLRESLERREEIALQSVLNDVARTSRDIDQLTEAIRRAHDARNHAMLTPIPAAELNRMLDEIRAAVELREKTRAVLEQLEQQRLVQTARYQAAHRDRKMLSEMAARQREDFERQRARAEQKALDDLFAARSQRG